MSSYGLLSCTSKVKDRDLCFTNMHSNIPTSLIMGMHIGLVVYTMASVKMCVFQRRWIHSLKKKTRTLFDSLKHLIEKVKCKSNET